MSFCSQADPDRSKSRWLLRLDFAVTPPERAPEVDRERARTPNRPGQQFSVRAKSDSVPSDPAEFGSRASEYQLPRTSSDWESGSYLRIPSLRQTDRQTLSNEQVVTSCRQRGEAAEEPSENQPPEQDTWCMVNWRQAGQEVLFWTRKNSQVEEEAW
jgi:hypothetical protein